MTHSLARFDAAPYGVYRWVGEVAPTRPAPQYNGEGDDGSGAVAQQTGDASRRQHTLAGLSRPPRRAGTALIKRQPEPGGAVFVSYKTVFLQRNMTNDSAKPIKQAESDRPQPIDIATRLRQTRANMLGTDDEAHYWDCHEAASEIERLRTIMYRIVDEDCTVAIQNGTFYADDEPLFSVPCTQPTHPTPGEGSTP